MPFILILLGAILIVAAFNNTQGDLAAALEQDVPPFLKWGLAVAAIGGLGWVPGLQVLSRWLLALVFTVIVLKNYQAILNGFQALGGASGSTAAAANPTPAAAYIANPNNPQFSQASISGTSSAQGGNINAAAGGTVAASGFGVSPFGQFDPGLFLTAAELGFGGFGGVA